jgi:hypothetical protein
METSTPQLCKRSFEFVVCLFAAGHCIGDAQIKELRRRSIIGRFKNASMKRIFSSSSLLSRPPFALAFSTTLVLEAATFFRSSNVFTNVLQLATAVKKSLQQFLVRCSAFTRQLRGSMTVES